MFSEIKSELKTLSVEIRTQKLKTKEVQRNNGEFWKEQSRLHYMRVRYRHLHIAYCLLRGRTMDQIERKSHIPPNEKTVESLMKKAMEKKNEAA